MAYCLFSAPSNVTSWFVAWLFSPLRYRKSTGLSSHASLRPNLLENSQHPFKLIIRALLALPSSERSERAQIVVSGERRSSYQANDDRRSVERLFEGCRKGVEKRGKTSSRGDDRGRVPHSGMVVSGSRGFGVFLRGAGFNESFGSSKDAKEHERLRGFGTTTDYTD